MSLKWHFRYIVVAYVFLNEGEGSMADETLSCTGCGALLGSGDDYCIKCGRKVVHLSTETEDAATTGDAVPEHTFIVYGNAVIPTPEEVAQYEASQSYELPPLNIYDWIFTPLEAWDRRPDAMRPGGWAWYGGLCGIGGVCALILLGFIYKGQTNHQPSQSAAILGVPKVTGPAMAFAPGLTVPSVAAVPNVPPPPSTIKVAPLYRIENGHYTILTVQEERQAARDAVAWQEQGRLSAATRKTDTLVQAAQRRPERSASTGAPEGTVDWADAR